MSVHAGRGTACLVAGGHLRRHRQDRQAASFLPGGFAPADFAGQGETVQTRHAQIGEQHVVVSTVEQAQGLLAVGGQVDVVPEQSKLALDHVLIGGMVVNGEDAEAVCWHRGRDGFGGA